MMKTCKRCLVTKSREEFYGQRRNKDGLRPYCKECDKSQRRKFCSENKEKVHIYYLRTLGVTD